METVKECPVFIICAVPCKSGIRDLNAIIKTSVPAWEGDFNVVCTPLVIVGAPSQQ